MAWWDNNLKDTESVNECLKLKEPNNTLGIIMAWITGTTCTLRWGGSKRQI